MDFYDEVLQNMQDKYTDLTGNNPDDASDIGIRLKVLAGELNNLYNNLAIAKAGIFPQTSFGQHLDMHGQMRGLLRKLGVCSTGVLRFSREVPATTDIIIPQHTTATISAENPIYYHTSQPSVIPAGKTSVDIPSVAIKTGATGNMGVGKITVLVNPVAGITRVNNITIFSGGAEEESDSEFRQRIVSSYANVSNGTNAAYYHDLAASKQGVSMVKIYPRQNGRGTVSVVICTDGTENEGEIVKGLSKQFESQREIGVDCLVYAAKKVPTNIQAKISIKEGYSSSLVKELCQNSIADYLNSLEIAQTLRRNHLGSMLLNIQGVKDYNFVSPLSDKSVLEDEKIVSGDITVSIGDD